MGPKVVMCNVVSAENETEAEFNILFPLKLKPKLKIYNAKHISMSRACSLAVLVGGAEKYFQPANSSCGVWLQFQ